MTIISNTNHILSLSLLLSFSDPVDTYISYRFYYIEEHCVGNVNFCIFNSSNNAKFYLKN